MTFGRFRDRATVFSLLVVTIFHAAVCIAEDPRPIWTSPSPDWAPVPAGELEESVLAAWRWTDGETILQIARESLYGVPGYVGESHSQSSSEILKLAESTGGVAEGTAARTTSLVNSLWGQTYTTYLKLNLNNTYKKKFRFIRQREVEFGAAKAQELVVAFRGNRSKRLYKYHGFVFVPSEPDVYRVELIARKDTYDSALDGLVALASSLELNSQPADAAATADRDLSEGSSADEPAESCFDLGVRYGRCAATVIEGGECQEEDDISKPDRCKGDGEFDRGIEEGARSTRIHEEPEYETMYVSSAALNVRAAPSVSSEVVDKLQRGDRITVVKDSAKTAEGHTWVQCAKGYVALQYLTDTPPPKGPPKVAEIARSVFAEIGAESTQCPSSLVGPLRSSPTYVDSRCASLRGKRVAAAQSLWDRGFAGNRHGFRDSGDWMDASSLAPGTTLTVRWYTRGATKMMVIAGSIVEARSTALLIVIESRN